MLATSYKLPNGTIITQQQYDALQAQQAAQGQLYKLENGTIINQQQYDALKAQQAAQAPAQTSTLTPAGNQSYFQLPNGTVISAEQAQAFLSDPNSGYSLSQ